jgi:polypeptide N-acetylgalactosaminyltransferase
MIAAWLGLFQLLVASSHIRCATVSVQGPAVDYFRTSIQQGKNRAAIPLSDVIRNDPAYWIADEEDDFYEHVYHSPSSFTHLRQNMGVKHYFPHICGLYRFNETMLPTVSVIMTLRNEVPGMVTLSAQSILARTPPDLLVEIIIINDDPSDPLSPELESLKQTFDKIVLHTTTEREGCARARIQGASMARGTVLMFVDSHVEMLSSTWYQHLVLPILDNPHTIASQQLQVMDDGVGHKYLDRTTRGSFYGSMTKQFTFTYESHRFNKDPQNRRPPPPAEPYDMPFAPGALFAIRKEELWRLGAYDRGIYVWGAENMELSLKIWLCGGRLVQVPCSPSGHMYRNSYRARWDTGYGNLTTNLGVDMDDGPYFAYGSNATLDVMNRIWLRNNIRVAKLWLGDWRYYYYLEVFGSKELPTEWAKFENEDEDMLEQMRIMANNRCRDFDWFDKHVFMRILGIHNPWYAKRTNELANQRL